MKTAFVTALAGFCLTASLHAQPGTSRPAPPPPLVDNSFLLEEAYNQEPRVVQHIVTFAHAARGRGWELAFEQEWPVSSMRHQLSFGIGLAHTRSRIGLRASDLEMNYRYQLLGMAEDARVLLAPRLSLVLPTGTVREGTGRGGTGFSAGMPLSIVLAPRVTTHTNVGVTYFPKLDAGDGLDAHGLDAAVGQSVIWFARPTLHLMLESLWTREETRVTPLDGRRLESAEESFLLSPGIRKAFNLRSGAQLVPGIAFPIEMTGELSKKPGVFVYLSFEHGF